MSEATAALASLLERAENIWAGEGMTSSDPLSVEVNGKYVDILFSTGGPHVEIQFVFDDAEAGEYWFENEVRYGRLTYMDWGTREEIFVTGEQAWLIQSGLMRDEDDLVPRLDSALMYVDRDGKGLASVEVHLADTHFSVDVEDNEPDDVLGPILSRALDEAIALLNEERHGLHTVPDFIVTGWSDRLEGLDTEAYEVSVTEHVPHDNN